jgi:hypothetical protein
MDKHFLGASLMQHNQIEWARQFGLPLLAKHGVDIHNAGQIETAITPMASTNVVLGALGEILVGMEGINKERDKLRETSVDAQGKPVNPFDTMLKESPILRLQEFRGAENELMLVIGDLLKGPALDFIKQLTEALRALTDFEKANPGLSGFIVKTSIALSGLSWALGGLFMTVWLASPVIKILGSLARAVGLFSAGTTAAGGLATLTAAEGGLAALAAGIAGLAIPVGVILGLLKIGSDHETPEAQKARDSLRRDRGSGLMDMLPNDGIRGRRETAPRELHPGRVLFLLLAATPPAQALAIRFGCGFRTNLPAQKSPLGSVRT